jgi:hypothetical protein
MMRTMRKGLWMVAALLGVTLSGCWWSANDRPPTYPVHGSLFVNGQPAAGATVQLDAVNDPKLSALRPHALVGADGTFRLTTFRTADGAPAGSYALTVRWPLPPRPGREDEGTDRFRGRYADPKRPVRRVEITPGTNELERIDLNGK